MKRLYYSILKDHYRKESKMLFLVGPRQVGKTTASIQSLPGALYLNWDNLEHRKLILSGPSQVYDAAGGDSLRNKKMEIIFDEIHKYPRWKSFLKGFYDTYSMKVNVCVTGSARLNIYKYGGDSMMGRYFIYRMHPLSISEIKTTGFLESSHRRPGRIPKKNFENLVRFGGYPEPYIRRDPRFFNRWKNLRLELMFNEDIRDITHISDIGRLKILADKIIHRAGGVVNYSNIAGDLQVSVDTVRRWFDLLESIYFCFRLHPYAKNINKAIRKEPKVYLWDWSLIKDQGGRNENFIACHLLKYVHYLTDTGMGDAKLHYVRDKNKREIDFLITREDIPWICLEAKSGDKSISPSLHYFKEATGSEHGFQLVFNTQFVDADCFKETKPVKVPVSTFLSQLV